MEVDIGAEVASREIVMTGRDVQLTAGSRVTCFAGAARAGFPMYRSIRHARASVFWFH